MHAAPAGGSHEYTSQVRNKQRPEPFPNSCQHTTIMFLAELKNWLEETLRFQNSLSDKSKNLDVGYNYAVALSSLPVIQLR